MASGALYKHLWEPKRTARDWGKTDYWIIRTWTPRAPPANDQGPQGEERLTHDITSKSRDSQKDSTEGGPTDANEEEESSGSLQSLQRAPGRIPTDSRNAERFTGLTGERLVEKPHLGSREDSDEGEIEGLGEDDGQERGSRNITRDKESHHANDPVAVHSAQRNSPKIHSQVSHATAAHRRSEPAVLASGSGDGRVRKEVGVREEETASDTESELAADTASAPQKTARKRKRGTATKKSVFTLWLTAYERSGRDLNELDICLSAYDSAMRDTMQSEGDSEVHKAMVQHWRMTRKYMLSTIRDLSCVSALEKRHRQELSKSRRLQGESLATLRTLRQLNGRLIKAAAKAKQARQAHKVAVEQAEIEELSSDISAYVARQRSHLH